MYINLFTQYQVSSLEIMFRTCMQDSFLNPGASKTGETASCQISDKINFDQVIIYFIFKSIS